MQLVLFSHPDYFSEELEWLPGLVENGLTHYHFRKPDWGIHQAAEFLDVLLKCSSLELILHQHYELANHFPVKGFHLTTLSRKQFVADELILPRECPMVSTGYHSIDEVLDNTLQLEYLFLSPIFPSISKPGYKKNFDINLQIRMNQFSRTPVYALGGMGGHRLKTAGLLGYQGAGLLGYIWQADDPLKAWKECRQLADSIKG